MKPSSTKLVPILFLTILLIGGCGATGDGIENANMPASNDQSAINENKNANMSKDNVEELDKFVRLPIIPEEATWRENSSDMAGGGNSALPAAKAGKIIVVLKYSTEDAQKIIEQIDKSKPAFTSDVDAESWFPPELIAKSQESGDENLKGTSYAADNFLREPYIKGKITRINDTDFFVLELTSL